ncbi:MAG: M1 family metallopeptidase [Chitinophagaceae bacterium]
MKTLFVFFCLCFVCFSTIAQRPYFQQETNYQIQVKLDDVNHILRGFEKIEYVNQSPDTLYHIFIHVWPNAYKNDYTDFAEHLIENKKTDFYYSQKKDRGFIDSLQFSTDGELLTVRNVENKQDILYVEFKKPLYPSQRVTISTPFRVVLPIVFSRLGHDEQNYQISQWYPKPAVYDNNGWHPMPYLDQSEFYSEFGTFQVEITLPQNYVVAATGSLETQSEALFIDSIVEKTKQFTGQNPIPLLIQPNAISSSSQYKTIVYKQQNIHDFAWFASKNYLIEKKDILLDNQKKVSCFSYFKPQHAKAYKGSTDHIASTIQYLSKHVGIYPYTQASIVDGKLEAGGGMEYPMITVIDGKSVSDLQTVIIHEVGHNWFYGILGNNEREHTWMDEGINSFYEHKIDELISNEKKLKSANENNSGIELKIKNSGQLAYQLSALQHTNQSINTASNKMTPLNVWSVFYSKVPLLMAYLEQYMGAETFEKAMKAYYSQFEFKHPQPIDFRKNMEFYTNENLAWLFDDVFEKDIPIDFGIKKVEKKEQKHAVYVTSKTAFKGPIPISQVVNDTIHATQWITYPYAEAAMFEAIKGAYYKVNALQSAPEIKFANNAFYPSRLFKKQKFGMALVGLGVKEKQQLFVLPAVGYNHYNSWMFGALLHNIRIPNNSFQFALAPMYSIGAKQLVGTGFLSYKWYPKNTFHKIEYVIQGRSFHHQKSSLNVANPVLARHNKILNSLLFTLPTEPREHKLKEFSISYYAIQENGIGYNFHALDSIYTPFVKNNTWNHYAAIRYKHRHDRVTNPYSYQIEILGNNEFIKAGLTAQAKVDYHMKNKGFYARFYAGKFLYIANASQLLITNKNIYLNAVSTGANDFLYDNIYMARNEQSGALAHQIAMHEGGLKIRTPFYANPLGISDNWMLALNLKSDIPLKTKIKLQGFFDMATFADAKKSNPSGNKMLYDAGFQLSIMNAITFYVPLLQSRDFKEYTHSIFPKNRLLNSISFSLDLSHWVFRNTHENALKLVF